LISPLEKKKDMDKEKKILTPKTKNDDFWVEARKLVSKEIIDNEEGMKISVKSNKIAARSSSLLIEEGDDETSRIIFPNNESLMVNLSYSDSLQLLLEGPNTKTGTLDLQDYLGNVLLCDIFDEGVTDIFNAQALVQGIRPKLNQVRVEFQLSSQVASKTITEVNLEKLEDSVYGNYKIHAIKDEWCITAIDPDEFRAVIEVAKALGIKNVDMRKRNAYELKKQGYPKEARGGL